jgi:hypothetical protein
MDWTHQGTMHSKAERRPGDSHCYRLSSLNKCVHTFGSSSSDHFRATDWDLFIVFMTWDDLGGRAARKLRYGKCHILPYGKLRPCFLATFGCNLPSGCYNIWKGVPRDFEDWVTSDLVGSDERKFQKKRGMSIDLSGVWVSGSPETLDCTRQM